MPAFWANLFDGTKTLRPLGNPSKTSLTTGEMLTAQTLWSWEPPRAPESWNIKSDSEMANWESLDGGSQMAA